MLGLDLLLSSLCPCWPAREGLHLPSAQPAWQGLRLPFLPLPARTPSPRTFCRGSLAFFFINSLHFFMLPQAPRPVPLRRRKEREGWQRKLGLVLTPVGRTARGWGGLGQRGRCSPAAFKLAAGPGWERSGGRAGSGGGGRAGGPHRPVLICCAAARLTNSCLGFKRREKKRGVGVEKEKFFAAGAGRGRE